MNINKNALVLGIVGIALIVTGVLIYANASGNQALSFLQFNTMSPNAAAEKALSYINTNLIQDGTKATLGNVSVDNGVVKFQLKVGDNSYDSYVTKNGKLLFVEGIDISNAAPGNNTSGTKKVSVDDDPVLGNPNAPVTLIEFSDYECPFCKRHFTDTYPQIKKDYIDTGKVKFVFRDFVAVPAHNPLATSEALAADCSREQGGDATYFKYHDQLYTRTTSNGTGLKLSDLKTIATAIGINANALQTCIDSKKYLDEFNKDNADAKAAGVSGTPSFFVGKSSADGVIEGKAIEGAVPYETFKSAIDALLAS